MIITRYFVPATYTLYASKAICTIINALETRIRVDGGARFVVTHDITEPDIYCENLAKYLRPFHRAEILSA